MPIFIICIPDVAVIGVNATGKLDCFAFLPVAEPVFVVGELSGDEPVVVVLLVLALRPPVVVVGVVLVSVLADELRPLRPPVVVTAVAAVVLVVVLASVFRPLRPPVVAVVVVLEAVLELFLPCRPPVVVWDAATSKELLLDRSIEPPLAAETPPTVVRLVEPIATMLAFAVSLLTNRLPELLDPELEIVMVLPLSAGNPPAVVMDMADPPVLAELTDVFAVSDTSTTVPPVGPDRAVTPLVGVRLTPLVILSASDAEPPDCTVTVGWTGGSAVIMLSPASVMAAAGLVPVSKTTSRSITFTMLSPDPAIARMLLAPKYAVPLPTELTSTLAGAVVLVGVGVVVPMKIVTKPFTGLLIVNASNSLFAPM